MRDMKEFWGMMNVLDNADDVAIFVVSGRDSRLLYCNHLVTVVTNAHAGSHVSQVWDMEDYQKANTRCNEGGTYRYVVEQSPFGQRRNVTVSKVVWSMGILAYAFLLTAHVDDKEEEEREKIFSILGQSYRHIFLMDMIKGEMTTLLKPAAGSGEGHYRPVYYHPVRYDEWKKNLITEHAHPDDTEQLYRYLEPTALREGLERRDYSFQYRRRNGESFCWTELRFLRLPELEGRIVVTERDVDEDNQTSNQQWQNEVILRSISNNYRSIYLLDLAAHDYVTVKQDELLFGIPAEGSIETLAQIVSEIIPDEGQKRDFISSFSAGFLAAAFEGGAENVVREYNSLLSENLAWMGVNALKPPYMPGMDNKCVLTFMDITEHKRVEAERNEKNIIVDVLSSRYKCVFFSNMTDGSFHSIQIPPEFRYIEKQFNTIDGAMQHYARAYVLEQYRDVFKNQITRQRILENPEDSSRRECIYRTVENTWIRLHVYPFRDDSGMSEALIVFEDYSDVMEQREMSQMYNAALLADYDYMFEYDVENDQVYSLLYDGERLVREQRMDCGIHTDRFREEVPIHPDDMEMFLMAFSEENLKETFEAGKTVSHMFLRRRAEGSSEYRLFMYGFHYIADMGRQRVLIMARDSEREIL